MNEEQPTSVTSRRTMLKLSAVGAPVFVTLKPAHAAVDSVTTCWVNLSTTDTQSQWIDATGNLVPSNPSLDPKTRTIFPPPKGIRAPLGTTPVQLQGSNYAYYSGAELKQFLNSGRNSVPSSVVPRLNSTTADQQLKEMQAHVRYIEKLGTGQGLTCWLSVSSS